MSVFSYLLRSTVLEAKRDRRFSLLLVLSVAASVFICGFVLSMSFSSYVAPIAFGRSIQGRTVSVLPGVTAIQPLGMSGFVYPTSEEKLSALKRQIGNVDFAYLESSAIGRLFMENESTEVFIYYGAGEYIEGKELRLVGGRWPQDDTQEIVINMDFAQMLQFESSEGSRLVSIDDAEYLVVGIVEQRTDSLIQQYQETIGGDAPESSPMAYVFGFSAFNNSHRQLLPQTSIVPREGAVAQVLLKVEAMVREGCFGQGVVNTNVVRRLLVHPPGTKSVNAVIFFFIGCILLGALLIVINVQLSRIKRAIGIGATKRALGVSRRALALEDSLRILLLAIIGSLLGLVPLVGAINLLPAWAKPLVPLNFIFLGVIMLFVVLFVVMSGVIPALIVSKTDIVEALAIRE
ncbi:MAG: hypothetical protein PHV61_07450 [Limnochordia bacterium]|nr:hypothetical protein [Limnochordia bacterium]MDD2629973.1 hypothetical protein [Limnochordia bacterium]MDD4518630.1 hypothetical protein [Limnochordia bacterium]